MIDPTYSRSFYELHKRSGVILLIASLLQCIAATPGLADRVEFRELPRDLPLPTLPVLGLEWTRNAIIIQPWGYTQRQMMKEELGDLPQELKEKYGFNVLCVMPPRALAAV